MTPRPAPAAAPPGRAGALPGSAIEPHVQDAIVRAEVRSLYENARAAAGGAFVTAVCLWGLFYWHTQSGLVLAWAGLIHSAQAARLALLLAFQRNDVAGFDAEVWRRRFRIALFATAVVWGVTPVLFLPADDVTYAAILMLVLLGVAVGGVSTVATDRLSLHLWLLPVLAPLPLALAWYGSRVYLVFAVLTIVFVVVNRRAVLAQNELLSTALRAQLQNAALVERLHQQMELTARASHEKSQFLAAASHDLRQPLHALSFFGATLERRLTGSVDQPLIYNMMRSIEALDNSFGAILDISKLDAGAVEVRLQPFPINDLFRRIHMSFSGQAEEAGLNLRFHAGSRVVNSDPQLLERILGNLVQNALRYSQPGGGVLVAARHRAGGVSLEVWDTGIGIAESELPKIFAEFYQVANSERDRSKGLGMGLAIVKRMTELLGHELTVRSRPGQGSVFRVWVERSARQEVAELALGAETLPGPLEESRVALLIDDEEAIRTSVAELLAEWRYEVIVASTTAEAVTAALQRHGAIDVIISDLRLRHGEDGLRAVEQVRAACRFDVPTVIVTGDTAAEQVLRVHESGHTVLYKPVQPRELLSVLKRLA